MSFFLFILDIKFLSYFKNKKKSLISILLILLICFIIFFNAFSTSLTIDYLIKINCLNKYYIFSCINIIISLIILIKNYFPYHKKFNFYFLNIHPIGNLKKCLLQLLFDFVNIFYVSFLIYFILIFIINQYLSIADICLFLTNIIFFYLISRIFSLFEKGRIKWYFILIAVSSIYFQFIIIFKLTGDISSLIKVFTGEFFLIIISFFLFKKIYLTQITSENLNLPKKNKSLKTEINYSLNKIIFISVIRRRLISVPLIIGFVFKIVIITVFLIFSKNKHLNIENNLFIFAIIFSPAIPYSYAFNNTFGLLPSVSLIVNYRSSFFKQISFYLIIIYRFIIVDLIITIPITIIILKTSAYILIEFITFFKAIIFGFISSIYASKKVSSLIDFSSLNSNTSIITSLILIFISIIFFFIPEYILIICLFETLILTIYFLLLFKFYKNSGNMNKIIFEKIF